MRQRCSPLGTGSGAGALEPQQCLLRSNRGAHESHPRWPCQVWALCLHGQRTGVAAVACSSLIKPVSAVASHCSLWYASLTICSDLWAPSHLWRVVDTESIKSGYIVSEMGFWAGLRRVAGPESCIHALTPLPSCWCPVATTCCWAASLDGRPDATHAWQVPLRAAWHRLYLLLASALCVL